MTLRRLGVLIRALSPDALLWAEVQAAHERSLKPTLAQLRERERHYRMKKEGKR